MMTEIIPMTDTHLGWVMSELREDDVLALGQTSREDTALRAVMYREQGVAWCVLLDNKPMGVGGVVEIFPGCGEAWMLVTNRVYKAPIAVTKVSKLIIAAGMEQLKLRRLQMNASVNRPYALKFARLLGFKSEGIMKCYGQDGSDHERFAICRATQAD